MRLISSMALGGLVMSVNHAGGKSSNVVVTCNAVGRAAEKDDAWLQISPYGEFPTNDGEFVQVFGKDQAETMAKEFNGLLGQAGRSFRGVPVYYGHPWQMPDAFPDKRRIGKIMLVEAREDGLYGKVEWNNLGTENLEQGYFVYPSPGWAHPKAKGGDNKVFPILLDHVGMVNNPNIESVQPWTNSKTAESQEQSEQPKDKEMKDAICKLLGLDPAMKDEDVIAKVTEMKAAADKVPQLNTDLAAAQKETADKVEEKKKEMDAALTAANSKVNSLLAVAADVSLDLAVNGGTLTEADRLTWKAKLIANGGAAFKTEAEALGKLTPALNTKPLEIGGVKVNVADASQRRMLINSAVEDLMTSKGLTYDVAYARVQADPRYKPIFDAMVQPKVA